MFLEWGLLKGQFGSLSMPNSRLIVIDQIRKSFPIFNKAKSAVKPWFIVTAEGCCQASMCFKMNVMACS